MKQHQKLQKIEDQISDIESKIANDRLLYKSASLPDYIQIANLRYLAALTQRRIDMQLINQPCQEEMTIANQG